MAWRLPRPSPRPSPRLWLGLLLVVLGAVLALIEQRDVRPPGPVPEGVAGEPDYYLEGVTLTRFDAQGSAHQRLESPRLVHTPKDDVTRARTPVARLYDDQGRTWFARGAEGTLGPGGNPLTLTGDANLESPGEGWRLDTETLHYDAEAGRAWSDSEARLSKPPQRMRGEQFTAWIDERRMRLTDEVRGFHPPEEQAP